MNRLLGVALLSLFVTACAQPEDAGIENQTEQDSVAGQTDTNEQNQTDSQGGATPIAGSDTEASAMENASLTAQEILEQPGTPLASRVIYFTYDSAKVTDDSMALLEAHGNFMAENGNVSVRLEGHADERGSREYNIALGDRRAQSVRRILLFQGASSDQIETVSYGEEQPAEMGHSEAIWNKNRRVELVYEVR